MAGDAAAGARVGLEELVEAGVDAGLLRGGDGDRGAGFEAGFRDAVAYARAAADDEDAGAGELVAVFLAVGHVEQVVWGDDGFGGGIGCQVAVDSIEFCRAGRMKSGDFDLLYMRW